MENLKKSFLIRGNNIVGAGGTGEENIIDSISVNGINVTPDENKNVDIEVPNIYVGDTEPINDNIEVWFNPSGESSPIEVPIEKIKVNGELQTPVNKVVDIAVPSIEGLTKDSDLATVAKSGNYEDLINKPIIPSLDGYAKTSEIPTKVSQLENDSNYLSSIPEEYVTDTELEAKGYLTEHQDISNLVEKEDGKGLSSNDYTTEEKNKLAGLENYNDTALSNRVKAIEDEVPNLATKTYVGEQIANAEHLKREIVTVLPSDEEASDNVIYMLKVESTTGNDKYQEYMKIDGTVQMVGDTSVDLTDYAKTAEIPTTVAELTDSADYAKTADIPTTLPANGGNADTVNNHTVKSDVPENAVFTDTVYDDTEVQKRISDNGYGEVAGGKNLLNYNIVDSKIINCSVLFKNDTFYVTNKGSFSSFVLSVQTIVGKSYTVTIKDWSDYSYRCTASVSDLSDNTLVSMIITDATLSMTFTAVGTESLIQIAPNNTPNEMSNTITFKCMLEEGSVATEYEPYFPSNKMLAEENEQQNTEAMDLKMLGWNVPEECPVQNYVDGNGVFHQRVGRVDLGTLDWSYSSDNTRFSTTGITDYKKKDSSTNTWVANAFLKDYNTVSGNDTAIDSYDKSIGFNGINDMFFVRNTSYTDETSFKNAMQGQYLYYELATEISMNVDGNEAITKVNESLGNYALKSLYSDTTINVGRSANSTVGNYSTAEGYRTTASGESSHAEGLEVTASGDRSHAEGSNTTASGIYSHAEGHITTASGESSHAEGVNTSAIGQGSHAEGSNTTASGNDSHAEGFSTYLVKNVIKDFSSTTTSDDIITAWTGKKFNLANGKNSHVEGNNCLALGESSHAEGDSTTASGESSHAEGTDTTASGDTSHAEGSFTTASGYFSHAEGDGTTASGDTSHAEGFCTTASGYFSHAEGEYTTADNYASHVSGKFNAPMTTGGGSNNTTGTAFVIGNGTSDEALSNAFSVQFDGIVKAKSTITASTTADYAEFFEWLDKNSNEEDRVGYFVTLDGNKIKIATSEDDYILGIVSGEPFVLGNGDCDTWNKMYLHDEFRRTIYEPAPKIIEILDNEGNPTGEYEEVEGEYEGTRPILNPDYDPTQKYISRFDRAEWSPVGMLGVLAVLHDGTAEVNGYVTVNNEGIATKCTRDTRNSYRVIKKVSDKVVEVIFR